MFQSQQCCHEAYPSHNSAAGSISTTSMLLGHVPVTTVPSEAYLSHNSAAGSISTLKHATGPMFQSRQCCQRHIPAITVPLVAHSHRNPQTGHTIQPRSSNLQHILPGIGKPGMLFRQTIQLATHFPRKINSGLHISLDPSPRNNGEVGWKLDAGMM